MVQQITKGIKISVRTNYDGTLYRDERLYYAFSYYITIENLSNDTVQLLSRQWNIFDSLSNTELVEGEGVVGELPTIKPQKKYTYRSNCFLNSPIGAMKGFFNMINFSTTKKFKVHIPTFQLVVSNVLNWSYTNTLFAAKTLIYFNEKYVCNTN